MSDVSKITVDGVEVPQEEFHNYSLRWYMQDGKGIPTLYYCGKRIVKAWTVSMDVSTEPDEWGGNANCA